MSVFEENPTSLKAFKECLHIGQLLRLKHAQRMSEGLYYDDVTHKGLNLLRAVAVKQSKDLAFRLLEGEKEGALTWLPWPSAKQLSFLRDERGFYGFRIEDEEAGVVLVYHFEQGVL